MPLPAVTPRAALPALALGAVLAACATNPATGSRELSLMSESQEIALGRQAAEQVRQEMGAYDDPALQEYVAAVGAALARVSERPDLPWQFTVMDSQAVNAFALPGGFIYITRGILPFLDNEAQLAGVLGHEVGHVTARHSAQQYSKATGAGVGVTLLSIFVPEARPLQGLTETAVGLLFLKYGRDDEIQADALGVRYASRAGWAPSGVAGMLRTLDRLDQASGSSKGVPNWLSTHPAPADRVARVEAAVSQASGAGAGAPARPDDRAGWLRRVDGLVYGDSPSEGLVRGGRFVHPELRFALTFPSGWELQNTRAQVAARAPERNHILLLQVAPGGGSPEQAARTGLTGAGFRMIDGQRATINGLDAYLGLYEGTVQGLGAAGLLGAYIAHGGRLFLLAGLAPADEFAQAQGTFERAARSFTPLSAAEAAAIHPDRIDIYTVRGGDTWSSIAESSGSRLRPETLAIMNNSDPARPPAVGQRIKVVVGG